MEWGALVEWMLILSRLSSRISILAAAFSMDSTIDGPSLDNSNSAIFAEKGVGLLAFAGRAMTSLLSPQNKNHMSQILGVSLAYF